MGERTKIIPVSEPNLTELERKHLIDAFDSGWISSKGKYIELFERKFAEFIGAKHAVAVSNGTVSLHLILVALGISPGDEVIVPSFTYIASVNAITYVGAIPVFVDSEGDTFNMNVEEVGSKITKKTKAIMAVHIYGHSVDIDPLLDIASKHGIYLIEDAAEAIGTKYKGKYVGQFGIAGSFSFFGNKTITTGEGGMVVTNDDELAKKIRKLKNQGTSKTKRYWHDVIGYNYRITNLQAAIGYAQILRVTELIERKRIIASWYKTFLKHPLVTHPVEKSYCTHSYWMYSILLDKSIEQFRDKIMQGLYDKYGIETRPFFYPATKMSMYRGLANDEDFPVLMNFYKRGINLPSSTKLTYEDVKYVSFSLMKMLDKYLERR